VGVDMKNLFKKDNGLSEIDKNIPEKLDFKFFDTLVNYHQKILSDIADLRKEVQKLRRLRKFSIIWKTTILVFILTTILAALTEYEEFILNIVRRISG